MKLGGSSRTEVARTIEREREAVADTRCGRVDARGAPTGAIAATTVVARAGLLPGLHSAAVGSLIAFGAAAIYGAFLLAAPAALVGRVRGT